MTRLLKVNKLKNASHALYASFTSSDGANSRRLISCFVRTDVTCGCSKSTRQKQKHI